MRSRPAEMAEYIHVCTTRLLQGIREDGEPAVVQRALRQMTFLVGGLSETDDDSVMPGKDSRRKEKRRAEGRAENITKDAALVLFLGFQRNFLCCNCSFTFGDPRSKGQ
jgi:hypothetical protein